MLNGWFVLAGGGGGGGGGGILQGSLRGGSAQGPIPYPFVYQCDRKVIYHLYMSLIGKCTHFTCFHNWPVL